MKTIQLSAVLLAASISTGAVALEVNFADAAWDGAMVPAGQQCQKFGGNNPATPKLHVSDIPEGSDSIVLEYSDRDSERMNNGGHGKMSYALSSAMAETKIPSVPGHSFDLPASFTMLAEHLGPKWDTAGAYMPPCSGGKGHAYYVTVKAVQSDKVLAETVLEMGKY